MIDIEEYRLQETIAMNSFSSWRARQPYILPTFEKYGFPSKYENLSRLRQFIDTFQEGRFDRYVSEDNGITEEEEELLITVILRNLLFQELTFSGKKQILPFDTAIASLKIFSRIINLKPSCKSILEIGPGSGFLAQFLYFSNIETYVGIEVCEVLYILQDLQFSHLFNRTFKQCVLDLEYGHDILIPNYPDINIEKYPIENEYEIERQKEKDRFIHIPWWKIGKILNEKMKFDIITSNANLTEFSVLALNGYLDLMSKSLKDNGVLVVCCFGGGEIPKEVVLKKLTLFKFLPIYLRNASVTTAFFIKEGHQLFEPCYNYYKKGTNFILDTPLISDYLNRMSGGTKRIVTKAQLFDTIRTRYFDLT